MKNKYIFKILVLTIVGIFSVFYSGCDEGGATPPNIKNYPSCANGLNSRYLRFQYFSVLGMTFSELSKNKADYPFEDRCKTNVHDTNYFGGHSLIPTVISTSANIDSALALHTFANKRNSSKWQYYLCSIDSISNSNGNDSLVGRSSSGAKWSYVFTGKIKRLVNSNLHSKIIGLYIAHELGHQTGQIPQGNPHGGLNSDKCLMKEAHHPDSTIYYEPNYTFCDDHACDVFLSITDSMIFRPYSGGQLTNAHCTDEIKTSIELDKTNYIVGENIVLNMQFKNVSGKDVTIKDLDDNVLHQNFHLINSKNEYATYKGILSTYIGSKYDNFKPEEVRSYRIFVLEDWGKTINPDGMPIGSIPYYLPEDTYTIKFIGHDGKITESNQITFKVEKPTGLNESAYDEWQKIVKMDAYEGKHVEKIIKIRDFMHKYPSTSYLDQAFMNMMLLDIYSVYTSDITIEDCIWFIDKKPNSVLIDYAIEGLIREIKKLYGAEETRKHLQNIIEKYPNTKASLLAKQFMNN